MANTISNRRKNTFRVLFFIMLISFLGVSILYINTENNSENTSQNVENIKQQLDSIAKENKTLLAILAVDELLTTQNNPKKALVQYQAISNTASPQLQSYLNSRINIANQAIKAEKQVDTTTSGLVAQLANQQIVIDSLSEVSERIYESKMKDESLQNSLIEKLQQKVDQQKNELARKEAKQVISFTNQNGNLIHYLGEVQNGKANGGGIGIWNTGSIYKGKWLDNMRHGKGEFKWADGQIYEGDFNNDIRSGEGVYHWPSGEKYVGEFENNRMNGQGILYDPDGNKEYEGEWKNDKPKL